MLTTKRNVKHRQKKMVLRHANQVVLIVGYVCGFASTSLPAFGMFDETDIAMALMKILQVYEI